MRAMFNSFSLEKLFAGTSGLVLPVRNKSEYPEDFRDKSRLTYYSSLFNSIEINSTFKKLPMPSTVEKWAASVNDDFRFSFKLSHTITHQKQLAFASEDLAKYFKVINHAGEKKGALLIQFPAALTAAAAPQLMRLLDNIYQNNLAPPWDVAIEFRHSSWYSKEIQDTIDSYGASFVLHDMHFADVPFHLVSRNFVYLRFHGTEKGYRGSYADEYLLSTSRQIIHWLKEGKKVYVYFNNTLGGAANNLITLKRMIGLA
jgi:uncharacterized protein YecE (DUF72 family)